MSGVTYQDLVTKSFRDNAIRSVMLIDDDFLPYDKLVAHLMGKENIAPHVQTGLGLAATIHEFFQSKKILCDVDSNTDHLTEDRIRKCDLVILDYHLEPDDPEKSLATIVKLSETEHLNLVVVYTNENLDRVWKQIAISLVGLTPIGKLSELLGKSKDRWDEITEGGTSEPTEYLDLINEEDIESFILSSTVTGRTRGTLARTFQGEKDKFAEALCSLKLESLNVLKRVRTTNQLTGNNSGVVKWLHSKNVFVILKNKPTDRTQFRGQEIWDDIGMALIDWSPTYYQTLISEIQNQIENEPMSFESTYLYDREGQAGWLYQIMQEHEPEQQKREIKKLVSYLADELESKLQQSTQLNSFANQLFAALKNEGDESLVDFCTKHTKVNANGILHQMIGHAVNYSLSTLPFTSDFITNGTILVEDENANNVYLCVTPACETVPNQYTGGQLIKNLRPHRLLKFLVLKPVDLPIALANATHSNYVFLKVNEVRKSYRTLNEVTLHPEIQYVLIKDHDSTTKSKCQTGIEGAMFSEDGTGQINSLKRYRAIAQLRDSYAARFQALSSHHFGRVGVDFVNFSEHPN